MLEPDHSDWLFAYQSAVAESDPAQLSERIHAAEAAIYFRLQELKLSDDGHVERQAIERATQHLRKLQVEKLNYPDWQENDSSQHT